jgi:hypothetical protein
MAITSLQRNPNAAADVRRYGSEYGGQSLTLAPEPSNAFGCRGTAARRPEGPEFVSFPYPILMENKRIV